MQHDYTIVHFDFESLPWLTSPRKKLNTKAVALGLIRIPANDGYTFTHIHRKQEEVYIVIEGSGTILLDEKQIDIARGDIIRVAPAVKRALKAHDQGLFVICSGAVAMGYPDNPDSRYMIDDGIPYYDDIPPWHRGNVEIAEKNRQLKERMEKARKKRSSKDTYKS